MALWRVRATIDDRPGFLAVLAASLALRSVNILAVQVHASEQGAIDDFLVDAPDQMTEQELLAAVAQGRGRDAWVAPTDTSALMDAPTRALELAAALVREPATIADALGALLDAWVEWRPEVGPASLLASLDGRRMCLPAPAGGAWLVERAGPDFTPAEYARAQALVAVAAAAAPHPPVILLLPDGGEITLRRAQGTDVDAVRELHDRCSPATLRRHYLVVPPRPFSRGHLLRRLLPASGWTLLAETATGEVVGMATLVGEGLLGELSLLVADAWQRRGVGTALLRRMVSGATEAGYVALYGHTVTGNTPMVHTLRRLGRLSLTERDGTVVTVTLPLASAPAAMVPGPAKG